MSEPLRALVAQMYTSKPWWACSNYGGPDHDWYICPDCIRKKNMNCYVLGFLYDSAWIALIEKNRPNWQAGKLNGIGGKINPGELADAAMHREFKEEAGLVNLLWVSKVKLFSSQWEVYVYACKSERVQDVVTKTDEEVIVCLRDNLYKRNLCPHLEWLIPMVCDEEILALGSIRMSAIYGGNTKGV
jgi:8-oxo-dGTP diphosphatase